MDVPDPSPVLKLIQAFCRSKTMFAAEAPGVFDRLREAPVGAVALSRDLQSDPDATERLLDACVGLGLLRKEDGKYSCTAVAETYLCWQSQQSLRGYILYANKALYKLWGNLEDAIREGTNRWTATSGPAENLFDHFYKTDEDKREFLSGMHGFGLISSPHVVAAFDLSRFRKLVDLGGGTGHLAVTACERYPNLRAAVFDLPAAIEVAEEFVRRSAARERVELIAGDFFEDPLPPADLFAVGRILHDWSEERIRRLLAKIYSSLPLGGGLLIAERLLDEEKAGPLPALMQSLNMLVTTEGKERALSEYATLLRQAGFSLAEGRRTGAPLDAIFAVKA